MKIYKSLRLTDIVFSVLIGFAFFFVIFLFSTLVPILADEIPFLIHNCFDSCFFISVNFYSTNNNKSTIDRSLRGSYNLNPRTTYSNPDLQKEQILKENKGKSGIYI